MATKGNERETLSYRHPHSGYFCGIFLFEDRLDIAFEWGALLPDPHGMLAGSGKQVRYLRLQPGREIPHAALVELLQAAVALPPGRDVRLALLRSTKE